MQGGVALGSACCDLPAAPRPRRTDAWRRDSSVWVQRTAAGVLSIKEQLQRTDLTPALPLIRLPAPSPVEGIVLAAPTAQFHPFAMAKSPMNQTSPFTGEVAAAGEGQRHSERLPPLRTGSLRRGRAKNRRCLRCRIRPPPPPRAATAASIVARPDWPKRIHAAGDRSSRTARAHRASAVAAEFRSTTSVVKRSLPSGPAICGSAIDRHTPSCLLQSARTLANCREITRYALVLSLRSPELFCATFECEGRMLTTGSRSSTPVSGLPRVADQNDLVSATRHPHLRAHPKHLD